MVQKIILLLSGENPLLAKNEAIELLRIINPNLSNRILCGETFKKNAVKNLGFSHEAFSFLFSCSTEKEFIDTFTNFSWNKVYKKDFCVRIKHFDNPFDYSEKELAEIIWNKLKNPKVNIQMPKTKIVILLSKDKIFCGKSIWANEEYFMQRRAHLRPKNHPTALHPKLARAMINLSGAKKGDIIVDPFCGAGGILIEAGILGFKFKGYDINSEMIERAKINIDYFKIKRYLLKVKDALLLKKCKIIVTDPPYGRNTSSKDLKKLYDKFLKVAKKKAKKIVIAFPDNYKPKGLKFAGEVYIHKGLSKNIYYR